VKQTGSEAITRDQGVLLRGDSVEIIQHRLLAAFKGQVNLIVTSPPYPLNQKKQYGNLQGEA
jgi:site-specific DNA-methyltransferase (cytosine-N4-specific)